MHPLSQLPLAGKKKDLATRYVEYAIERNIGVQFKKRRALELAVLHTIDPQRAGRYPASFFSQAAGAPGQKTVLFAYKEV